jgi:tetratricopeptide (TPR) repeat protein
MKVVTLISVLILIAGVMVIFLPEILCITQPTHTMGSGLHQIGNIFASLGMAEVAAAAYDSSLSIEPDNYNSLINKGDVLASSGRHLEALTTYTHALDENPDNIAVMKKKSDVLKNLGRDEESHALLLDIARTSPSQQSDHLEIVRSSMLTGNYPEAVNKIEDLLTTYPNDPNLYEMKGDALIALAKTDTILQDQLKDLQSGGTKTGDPVLKNTLSRNQAFSDGIASYRKVILLDPMRSTAISEKMFNTFQGFGIIVESETLLQDL